jgi:hypothetical protein
MCQLSLFNNLKIIKGANIKYYAHPSDNSEKPWQEIVDHSKNTAKIAGKYASGENKGRFFV